MKIINIEHFSDIDRINESDDMLAFCNDYIANIDCCDDDFIAISGPMFRLRSTSLIIATGTYCTYNEDTGEYEPDFNVSLLYYAPDEPDFDMPPLYWDQGSPASMFHDYVVMQGDKKVPSELVEAVA